MTKAHLTLLAATTFALGGCSSIGEKIDDATGNQALEYKQSRQVNALEIPPDLTTSSIDDQMVVPDLDNVPSGSASLSDYQRERSGQSSSATRSSRAAAVLQSPDGVEVLRDDDRRWLRINGSLDDVWARLRDYWVSQGWLLKVEDPRIGIMETDWAENRAGIPDGPIRSVLSKVVDGLYDAGTRDKYRTRVEPGPDGTVEVFITHYGAEEQFDGSGDTTRWIMRPRDPELETEVMRRIAVYFGVEDRRSQALVAKAAETNRIGARLVRATDGSAALEMREDFNRSWRITGLILDRVGFAVEDRIRKEGTYFVRYFDPLAGEEKKGFLSKLAFWNSDEKPPQERFQIKVAETAPGVSQVTVHDENGNPDRSDTAARILERINEELR
ncbi:MAG: outer membrane protein assembly factor BamC [Gammaproteobacteria bacterium]